MKEIKNYEGLYWLSCCGNIINRHGKELKPQHDKDGYLSICLCKNNIKKTYRIHQLVAQHWFENPENKIGLNHLDGNKENNFPWNLEYATTLENNQHAIVIGLVQYKGIKNPANVLTEQEVLEIRAKFIPRKYSQRMLAREYGVSQCTINNILLNKQWKHI
jgi:hypothetical protein